jgi:hypothetical protein
MRKFPTIAAAALIALTVSACSGNDAPDAGEVTETQMDDIEVIDGTISDEMVDVDTMQKVDPADVEEEATADAKKETAAGDEQPSAENPVE